MKKSYFIALLCLFVIGLTFGQNIPFTKVSPTLLEEAIEPPIYKRVKISKSIPNYFERLINSGVDMQCGATYNMDSVILELSENDLSSLTANGINYTVVVENLTQYYSERAQKDMARVQSELAVDKSKNTMLRSSSVRNIVVNNIGQHNDSQEIDFKTPQNFNIPSTFGGCLTNSQLNAELDKMRQMYPHLISVKANISPTNQLTHQGLPVYFVKISDNPDVNEAEPQTMYNGMIHSREVASMMNLVYYMWYLLENYENDPFIKNLVDNSELYFIPVLNPDGLEWNERIAPNGGGMQRKNRRLGVCNTSSGASSTANTFEGIDWIY
ncbi:M14 family zinc carboxypeptidase [Flavobacterium sp.]|uniref:M14 family zinc carboxypeptidase n=1 Tax=Flavobacterium sp. TaxID=239 RepID=UPI003F698008